MRDGSFVFDDPNEADHENSRKRMRLCLFYVNLVTLRYLGYRQQCIRNCVLGRHIKFIGKTIYFHWDAGEVKNNNEIEGHLTKVEDDELHGVLIEALFIYYKKVYPYIDEHSGDQLGKSFFVKLGHNKFHPFSLKRANDFTEVFIREGWEFIQFDDRLEFDKRRLNPHFFRGLTCDWLKEKGASNKAIADYVGDTEKTVNQKYLRKDLPRSNRKAIQEIKVALAPAANDKELIESLREDLRAKDRLIEALTEELKLQREKSESDGALLKSLQNQMAILVSRSSAPTT